MLGSAAQENSARWVHVGDCYGYRGVLHQGREAVLEQCRSMPHHLRLRRNHHVGGSWGKCTSKHFAVQWHSPLMVLTVTTKWAANHTCPPAICELSEPAAKGVALNPDQVSGALWADLVAIRARNTVGWINQLVATHQTLCVCPRLRCVGSAPIGCVDPADHGLSKFMWVGF